VYALSGGIPRVINVLCDRALLGAYVQGKDRIDRATLAQAAREVFTSRRRARQDDASAGRGLDTGGGRRACVDAVSAGARETRTASLQPPPAAPADPIQPAASQAARPVAALPDTLEWPDAESRSHSKAIAYAALFRAWGVDYLGADACQQAESLGLRCRTARGGLDDLRQFNRPAVLQMRDPHGQGQSYFATLTGLDEKSARFAIGAKNTTVALGALASQWSGHYILLWRTLPDAPGRSDPVTRTCRGMARQATGAGAGAPGRRTRRSGIRR